MPTRYIPKIRTTTTAAIRQPHLFIALSFRHRPGRSYREEPSSPRPSSPSPPPPFRGEEGEVSRKILSPLSPRQVGWRAGREGVGGVRGPSRGRFPPNEALPGSAPAHPRSRDPEARPHRHRHALGLRLPDALRPLPGVPAADHQEAPLAVDPLRAALVPGGGYERPLSPRAR